MKQNKTISLDTELISYFSENPQINSSQLINRLLSDFVGQGGELKTNEIKEKIIATETEIKEKQLLLSNLQNQLRAIEEKENKIKDMFKNIPAEALQDFRSFPKMDELALRSRYDNYYYFYDVSFEEILQAFRKFKETQTI
jgi:hypothetical protein